MKPTDSTFWLKQIDSIGIGIVLGIVALVLGLGVKSTLDLLSDTAWVEHTHQVIESLDQIRTSVSIAVGSQRGYLLTGDVTQLDVYNKALQDLQRAAARVRTLTRDNPRQQRALDGLEPFLKKNIARVDAAIEYRWRQGFEPESEADETRIGTVAYFDISKRLDDLTSEERRLLVERKHRTASSVFRTKSIEAAGACASMGLLVVVVARLRREVRRRHRSEQTVRERELAIQRLNEDLERRVEEGTAQLELAHRELESFSWNDWRR
jgi:methyl-accepting chemotaxis protein